MSLESFAKSRDLLEQMDEDGYIPISTILLSPTFSELSPSLEEIQKAVKASDKLQLSSDETGVRLILPVERKTIILREVPEDVTEAEIRDLIPDIAIVQLRKEVDSIWFLVFDSESTTLQALRRLQSQTLRSHPIKARVKSEFYKKELQRRLDSLSPPRKLSADAAPFEVAHTPSALRSGAEPFLMPELTIRWGCFGLPNGTEFPRFHDLTGSFGYYYQPAVSSVPLVITTPTSHGYAGEFVKYPREELYAIVQQCRDVSLPAVSEEVRGLGVVGTARRADG